MKRQRIYADTSQFRAPYGSPNLTLTGLGAMPPAWPAGRRYYDVARFRAPYASGYFGNPNLQGLGATPLPVQAIPPGALPDGLARYIATGQPQSGIWAGLAGVSAQVPQLAWLALAGASGVMGVLYYRAWAAKRKKRGGKKKGA